MADFAFYFILLFTIWGFIGLAAVSNQIIEGEEWYHYVFAGPIIWMMWMFSKIDDLLGR
jgi:hypothetical protein